METLKEELKKLEIFVKGIALKLKQRQWLYGLYVQILKKKNFNGRHSEKLQWIWTEQWNSSKIIRWGNKPRLIFLTKLNQVIWRSFTSIGHEGYFFRINDSTRNEALLLTRFWWEIIWNECLNQFHPNNIKFQDWCAAFCYHSIAKVKFVLHPFFRVPWHQTKFRMTGSLEKNFKVCGKWTQDQGVTSQLC